MRFKKGTKVEVLIKKEVPTGAWCCGEIIAGNGHTYSVKYGWFPITGEAAMVEKVPRKAIRPCPPPINGTDDWFAGHVIEVFDELCWKPAVIARVLGGNNFSVRIIGSNSELKAHQSRLRVRQSWQDGNWFLVRKVSSSSTRSPKRKRSSLGDIGVQKKRVIDKGCIGGKRIIVRLLIQPLKRFWIRIHCCCMQHGLKELLQSYPLVLGRFHSIAAQGPGAYFLLTKAGIAEA
ncbi:DUF724 domain-containing protein 7-like isoform X11 [Durio zibethinus]|uniref:DUF724 domain-containing protein 7-like isoform X11 n=1 Tax=Durio zibethinus TaxID=66656 RepID=A0A6P5WHH9_DURZI|nr:DUF724 domain-containing protein 7-like isoform X11 [Durio zibethinus]